ncbi:MAG: adenylate/guanylate cyclase domain-containing protein [Planctomycetota bacterium]
MPDLIAQGPSSGQRWRRELPESAIGTEITIGRSEADWIVDWDAMISRCHVRLVRKDGDRVEVSRMPSARNPVFHRGQSAVRFVLVPGDHFVIGHTTFMLVNRPGASDDPAGEVTEHAYDPAKLKRRNYRDASSRIEVLSCLPDLITGSTSDEELLVRVTTVLLQATSAASAVAVVRTTADGNVEILHYDSRVAGRHDPSVSARLARSVNESREAILHLWSPSVRDVSAYTASEEVDWAFCVPLRSEACPGWALYVTGQLASDAGGDLGQSLQAAPDNLEDDVKFAELVATTVANLQNARRLERRQSAMRHFFAPVVMDALATRDVDEVLEPKEADLSVLFCDLRGFSRVSERDSAELLSLLQRVSDALGVMTQHILATDGVIGDFHGDSAMGFWGWPLQQEDASERAAEAAIQIFNRYAQDMGPGGFRCGIGIASGRAVAGRIGTTDQVKVTAFGPVVNVASRLEGITKSFGAEIIVDDTTADRLSTASHAIGGQLRRLAKVRLKGMQNAIDVHQLIPPFQTQALSGQQVASYELALRCLESGDWDAAYEELHALPAWDRAKDVLLGLILRHNRVPPLAWDGVVNLETS